MQLQDTKRDRFCRPLKLDEIVAMKPRNDIHSFSDTIGNMA